VGQLLSETLREADAVDMDKPESSLDLCDARDMAADLSESMTGKAEQALRRAADEVRRVSAGLRTTRGLTGKDVALVLEVTEQRVAASQRVEHAAAKRPSGSRGS